jgi:hypothetical protein
MWIYWGNIWRHQSGSWLQLGLPNGQWPQAYFKSCGKMA